MKHLQKVQGGWITTTTTLLLQFRSFYEVSGDKIFKSNNVMAQEYAVDFNLLCSAKRLHVQMILGTVFKKGRKKGMFCNSETC